MASGEDAVTAVVFAAVVHVFDIIVIEAKVRSINDVRAAAAVDCCCSSCC